MESVQDLWAARLNHDSRLSLPSYNETISKCHWIFNPATTDSCLCFLKKLWCFHCLNVSWTSAHYKVIDVPGLHMLYQQQIDFVKAFLKELDALSLMTLVISASVASVEPQSTLVYLLISSFVLLLPRLISGVNHLSENQAQETSARWVLEDLSYSLFSQTVILCSDT